MMTGPARPGQPSHTGSTKMTDAVSYQQMGTAARGQAHALFAQTMG